MLKDLRALYPHASDFQIANVYRASTGELIEGGDFAVAMIDGIMSLVEIHLHMSIDGALITCMNCLIHERALSGDQSSGTMTFRIGRDIRGLPSDVLVAPVIHLRDHDLVTALLPPFFRL